MPRPIKWFVLLYGADERDRTADLRFTKASLYQLSYIGMVFFRVKLEMFDAESWSKTSSLLLTPYNSNQTNPITQESVLVAESVKLKNTLVLNSVFI